MIPFVLTSGNQDYHTLHESFKQEVSRQITRQLAEMTGFNGIGQMKYCLCYEYQYEKNGKVYIKATLIRTVFGHYIWITWHSKKNPEIQQDPTKEIDPEDIVVYIPDGPGPDAEKYSEDNIVRVSVHQWILPDLLEELHVFARPGKIIRKAKSGYSFDVEIWYPAWPDVTLEIYAQNLQEEQADQLLRALAKAYAVWNRLQDEKGGHNHIHFLNEMDRNEQCLSVAVDFGHCRPFKALYHLLEAISKLGMPTVDLVKVE